MHTSVRLLDPWRLSYIYKNSKWQNSWLLKNNFICDCLNQEQLCCQTQLKYLVSNVD